MMSLISKDVLQKLSKSQDVGAKKTRHIRFQDQTRVAKLNFHMSPVKSNDKVANTNHSVFLGNQISCNLPGFISTPVSF